MDRASYFSMVLFFTVVSLFHVVCSIECDVSSNSIIFIINLQFSMQAIVSLTIATLRKNHISIQTLCNVNTHKLMSIYFNVACFHRSWAKLCTLCNGLCNWIRIFSNWWKTARIEQTSLFGLLPGQSPMGVGMSVYRDEYNLLIRYPENLFTFTLLIRRDLENSFYLFYGHYFMDQLLI